MYITNIYHIYVKHILHIFIFMHIFIIWYVLSYAIYDIYQNKYTEIFNILIITYYDETFISNVIVQSSSREIWNSYQLHFDTGITLISAWGSFWYYKTRQNTAAVSIQRYITSRNIYMASSISFYSYTIVKIYKKGQLLLFLHFLFCIFCIFFNFIALLHILKRNNAKLSVYKTINFVFVFCRPEFPLPKSSYIFLLLLL